VVHHVRPDFEGEGYAGDYLAYADAALQYYLSTGRYSVLQSGRRVLLRCLEKFDGTGLGTMKLAQDHGPPFPWTESLPELYDSGTPSAMSHAILLAGEYGRVFIQDKSFVRFANAAIGTFGLASFTLKERGAGFYCAASRAFDDEYFVTTGPEAQELADTIAAKQPFRLCVPAFGDIRADIQSRGPGVYLVRGATVRGPFGAKDALAKVSPYLGLSR
jgi:uncharacterized protein YyaL (SSP411 family)